MSTGRIERTPRPAGKRPAPAPKAKPAPVAAVEVEEQAPTPATRPARTSRTAVAVHVASLVAGFGVLLYANRDQWFFGDEWEFLGHRGVLHVLHGDRSIWAPHTEHWSTIPILIYRALYSLVGIRTYVPYVAVLLVLHVAVAHVLWQIMRKVGADMTIATGLAAVYALFGAGYENLLWAFQVGFIASVALGLATLLLVNHDGRWRARDYCGWAVSITGLLCSGVSVTMVTVAGLTVLMRRGARQAALTVAVPGVVYLVWLALVGHQGLATHQRSLDDVFAYPDYIWTGLRAAVEQAVGFPGSGPLIVLGLAAWLLRRGDLAAGPAAPAFACAVGVIIIYSVIAVGRTSLGVQQSEASRYTYIAIALGLPAMALALSELAARTGGRQVVVCFLLLLVLLHNGAVLRDESHTEATLEQDLKTRILAAAELVTSPAIILNDHPEPEYSPDIVNADLRRMAREDKLPTKVRLTADDRLAAAAVLQYTAGVAPPATTFGAPILDGVVGGDTDVDTDGCVVVTPTGPNTEVDFDARSPLTVTLTTQTSGELMGYLRTFSPTRTSPPRLDQITAGVPLHVSATAAVDQVVVRIPPTGQTRICGVQ